MKDLNSRTIKRKLKYYFNINSNEPFSGSRINLRKDGVKTKPIVLKIKQKKNIAKFFKEIAFENAEKQRKLLLLMGD